jgi:hypothetical protein
MELWYSLFSDTVIDIQMFKISCYETRFTITTITTITNTHHLQMNF